MRNVLTKLSIPAPTNMRPVRRWVLSQAKSELSVHGVLQESVTPDLELREFGDFGIKFAIEFWCDGIDDGENKFTSDLNFIVWRTLKKHGIEMPLPQREVRILKD